MLITTLTSIRCDFNDGWANSKMAWAVVAKKKMF